MADVACKCASQCSHKTFDPLIHPRSQLFFRSVGELLSSLDVGFHITSGLRCPEWNKANGGPRTRPTPPGRVRHRPNGLWMDLALAAEAANLYSPSSCTRTRGSCIWTCTRTTAWCAGT